MVNLNAFIQGQEPGTTPGRSNATADPHGLISSFIRHPPGDHMRPNDVFVIWLLSHRGPTTPDAARTILEVHGATMLRSSSDWVTDLRELFLDIVTLSTPTGFRHATGDSG